MRTPVERLVAQSAPSRALIEAEFALQRAWASREAAGRATRDLAERTLALSPEQAAQWAAALEAAGPPACAFTEADVAASLKVEAARKRKREEACAPPPRAAPRVASAFDELFASPLTVDTHANNFREVLRAYLAGAESDRATARLREFMPAPTKVTEAIIEAAARSFYTTIFADMERAAQNLYRNPDVFPVMYALLAYIALLEAPGASACTILQFNRRTEAGLAARFGGAPTGPHAWLAAARLRDQALVDACFGQVIDSHAIEKLTFFRSSRRYEVSCSLLVHFFAQHDPFCLAADSPTLAQGEKKRLALTLLAASLRIVLLAGLGGWFDQSVAQPARRAAEAGEDDTPGTQMVAVALGQPGRRATATAAQGRQFFRFMRSVVCAALSSIRFSVTMLKWMYTRRKATKDPHAWRQALAQAAPPQRYINGFVTPESFTQEFCDILKWNTYNDQALPFEEALRSVPGVRALIRHAPSEKEMKADPSLKKSPGDFIALVDLVSDTALLGRVCTAALAASAHTERLWGETVRSALAAAANLPPLNEAQWVAATNACQVYTS